MHAHVSTNELGRLGVCWSSGGPVTARTEAPSPTPRGEAMVAELKWVHDMIRRDLGTVRQLAAGGREPGRRGEPRGPAAADRGAGGAEHGPAGSPGLRGRERGRHHAHHERLAGLVSRAPFPSESLPSESQPPVPGAAVPGGAEYECARAWSALTAAHTRVSGRLSDALGRGFGLTINDFEILLRIDHAPDEGIRLGELSSATPLTQPALSRAVARLAQRGSVARSGVPLDRRGVLITMTRAGRDLLRQAIPVHASVVRDMLLDRLSPGEQELLAQVLSRVAEGS
ncbi:MAG: MarR family winged helix-turn-helix transcriptional regulator [Streptosporangiaceae bacterium]